MTEEIPIGAPWKHCLEITELQTGKLDAGISLVGAKWIRPTVAISAAIAALLTYASFKAFGEGNIGAGVASALFACLAFVVAVFAIGCLSYAVRLNIEGSAVTFGHRYFWICRGAKGDEHMLGYLRCWSHTTGSGSTRTHSYHVCLHPLSPLPVISLFSTEYLPDIGRHCGEIMGMKTDKPSNEEALNLVVSKANEIAACLDIENRTGSNN